MLTLSEKGDNATVDMLVGDIYGTDYTKLGLKSTTIASSFGKVFKHTGGGKEGGERGTFKAEDISRSLLYAVSNNIGQIACVVAVLVPWFGSPDGPGIQIHERGEIWLGQDLLRRLFHSR